MGLNIEIKKQVLHFTEDKKEMFIARALRGDTIDTKLLASEVAMDTGARPKQVQMILTSIFDSIIKWMGQGHGVRLDGFGSFLPVVKSDSSENAEEAGVKKIRVSFFPSKALATAVGNISYSTENLEEQFSGETEEETPSQGGNGGTDNGSGDEGPSFE